MQLGAALVTAEQGEGVGAVRQPQGVPGPQATRPSCWSPQKLPWVVPRSSAHQVSPQSSSRMWERLIMLSERTTSQRLCRPRVMERETGTMRSKPCRSRIMSWKRWDKESPG